MEIDLPVAVPDLFDQVPCGLLALDADLNCLQANLTLRQWLGHARPDADAGALFQPADHGSLSQARHHIDQLRQSGQPQTLDLVLRRADGGLFHARLLSVAVFDAQGRFTHCSSTVTPAPEPQASSPSSGATEAMLRSITDRIPARLAYYDKDLVCRFANAAHAARYGKQPSDMVGSNLSEVVRPEVLHEILPRVASALSGQTQTFEAERMAKKSIVEYSSKVSTLRQALGLLPEQAP